MVLDPDELDAVGERFGVAQQQVLRDHLISHLLGVISEQFGDQVVFIGGTALARTHLPEGRLSEDVDLVAIEPRRGLAADLDGTLPRSVSRTHGRLRWDPALSEVRDTESAMLVGGQGITVKIQLLSARDRTVWPYEVRNLEQRYSDAPPARMRVPTLAAFAASKTATWTDRHAARDLWDLWALTRIGAINDEAADLYRRFGPTNQLPGEHDFAMVPESDQWRAQLAGQTRLTVSADDARRVVRDAWTRLAASASPEEDEQ